MFDLKLEDGIATVALVRPPVNAMNDAWIDGLHTILDDLAKSDVFSVLHFRSELKAFSAGADLQQLRDGFGSAPRVQAAVGRRYQELFSRIEALAQVTIAEIHGAALGGGLELTLACDLRIAARDARLGLPEVTLGVIPGAGGTQRLTRLCGRGQALRLILGAEIIGGEEAHRIGLVQWCVERSELQAEARVLAERIAALPAHAVAAAKACIAAASPSLEDGFESEVRQVTTLLGDTRTKALVAKFLNA